MQKKNELKNSIESMKRKFGEFQEKIKRSEEIVNNYENSGIAFF